ncbi:MAG TPA: transcription-repair coupling factor, partial [Sutterella sp.]|nr:transcription-repair coupling factor [Sutterella sp.]
GFGKTEVALRAAFVAVMNGRQVAVLCPTTLLAEQHAQTFRDRFAAWPVTIAELSRFRSGKETTAAIAGIKSGSVDIVIGTHKLLSEKIEFARLGLVVIDEEHRFGVRQKERLKSLRAEVDVLTLTATPIPRTLAMSLEGIRDFSVIATAPEKRLAIKTFVRRESDELIREAVIRELKRGGQVYFLHNEVETILNRFERLEKLLPEARIGIAHGQMAERDLERVMRDFYQQRYNVLLCTTIIETGIDNPNANTIIMHRADKFGLAQLHQLRGRVGRSHHQAYAYLLTPGDEAITKNAQKRLDAIQNLEDLGSGFYLSMHDLEIRGAGEVLGDEQSGEMQQVGFDLYSQMLKTAVESLKKGEEPNFEHPFASMSEINLHMPALLPDDFVPDVGSRLSLYKRLAATDDIVALEHVIDDINDRFGKLPEAARALIATHRLRLVCRDLGIKRIDAAESAIVFIFSPQPKFDPMNLIGLLQTRRDLRMMGPEKMRMTVSSADLDSRVRAIRTITNALAGPRKPQQD